METYFDPDRFESLADAQAGTAQMLGLDVLIADLARFGIALEEYLGVPCRPAPVARPKPGPAHAGYG